MGTLILALAATLFYAARSERGLDEAEFYSHDLARVRLRADEVVADESRRRNPRVVAFPRLLADFAQRRLQIAAACSSARAASSGVPARLNRNPR